MTKVKYLDLPPKRYEDWRDSFSVRTIDTTGTPGLILIEVQIAGHRFQLYPNEFEYLKNLMEAHR